MGTFTKKMTRPVEIAYNQSANQRPKHWSNKAGYRDKTHSANQFRFRKRTHQRQASNRYHHGSAETLENAARNQYMYIRRKSAQQRAQRKQANGGSKHPARTEAVCHPAANRDEDRETQRIARQHRFQTKRADI